MIPSFKQKISFIIPALNEERHIGANIDQVLQIKSSDLFLEIIVIDNGSKDDTAYIATKKGAKVLSYPGLPISALRNKGASAAGGSVLVFLDADVAITPAWLREIRDVLKALQENPFIVTGSICGISEDPGWLERNWFDPALRRKAPRYINSGHLIVSRSLFEAMKGFNENLETGEDVDFCERARSHGARILLNSKLSVIHEGYPKDFLNFFKREKRHARGDYSSMQKMIFSMPAMVSLVLLLTLVLSILVSLLTKQVWPLILYLCLFVGVCLAASIHRFGILSFRWIRGGLVYAVYFVARSFSFVEVILLKKRWL